MIVMDFNLQKITKALKIVIINISEKKIRKDFLYLGY